MKKKSYPKHLKVGSTRYALTFSKSVGKDPSDRGTCDIADKVILIRHNMSERETFETLIHEMLHAMEKEHNVELSHKTVYELEKALAQVLKDNFYLFFKA